MKTPEHQNPTSQAEAQVGEAVQRRKEIYKVTLWGSLVNFVLPIFKFLCGWLGGSSAMVADAVHSLSDFLTDIVVIAFVRLSGKPCDADHDFGHGKYETLATATIGLMSFAIGIGIFWSSAVQIYDWMNGGTLGHLHGMTRIGPLVYVFTSHVCLLYTPR